MNRRDLLKFAGGVAAGLTLMPLSSLAIEPFVESDTDKFQRWMDEGRSVDGGTYHIHRPIRLRHNQHQVVIQNCTFVMHSSSFHLPEDDPEIGPYLMTGCTFYSAEYWGRRFSLLK